MTPKKVLVTFKISDIKIIKPKELFNVFLNEVITHEITLIKLVFAMTAESELCVADFLF